MWRDPDELQDPDHKRPEKGVLTCTTDLRKMSTQRLFEQSDTGVVFLEPDCIEQLSLGQARREDNGLFIFKSHFSRPPRYLMRKKLLVLDVNGLLVDIVSPPPKDLKADINIYRRAIFKRPFYQDFLNFCFERFEVGIWSSRTRKNLSGVVDYLLGDMKRRLLFCWDLSYCTASGFNTLENKHKRLVFKDLRRIWEKQDPNLPCEPGEYNESNTVLLDDSPYKALLNPPHTAVFPYSFKFKDDKDTLLGPGGDLRVYLEGLAEAENVQKYVGRNPFGQSPITEGNAAWDFYHMGLHFGEGRTCWFFWPRQASYRCLPHLETTGCFLSLAFVTLKLLKSYNIRRLISESIRNSYTPSPTRHWPPIHHSDEVSLPEVVIMESAVGF